LDMETGVYAGGRAALSVENPARGRRHIEGVTGPVDQARVCAFRPRPRPRGRERRPYQQQGCDRAALRRRRPRVILGRLPDDVDQVAQERVARGDHPGVRLERPLRADEVDELLGDLHIRLLERRGHDRPVALRARGGDGGRARVDRRPVELVAAGGEALGGGEVRDRELEERPGLAVVEGAGHDAARVDVQADEPARAEPVLRDEVDARGAGKLPHAVEVAGGAEVEGDRLRRGPGDHDARGVAVVVARACEARPATEMSWMPPAVVPSGLSAAPWRELPMRLVTRPSGWSEKLPARE